MVPSFLNYDWLIGLYEENMLGEFYQQVKELKPLQIIQLIRSAEAVPDLDLVDFLDHMDEAFNPTPKPETKELGSDRLDTETDRDDWPSYPAI